MDTSVDRHCWRLGFGSGLLLLPSRPALVGVHLCDRNSASVFGHRRNGGRSLEPRRMRIRTTLRCSRIDVSAGLDSKHVMPVDNPRLTEATVDGRDLDRGRIEAEVSRVQEANYKIAEKVWKSVRDNYVDESCNGTDWEEVRTHLQSRKMSSKFELFASLQWMLAQLHDPHTRFIPPQEFSSFTNSVGGKEVGIGASIQVRRSALPAPLAILLSCINFQQPPRYLELSDVSANGAAFKAGLREGDIVLEVDGSSTERMTPAQANKALRGAVGSRVQLRLRRSGTGEEREPRGKASRLFRAVLEDTVVVTGNEKRLQIDREHDSLSAHFVPVVDRAGVARSVGYLEVREWSKSTFRETLQALRMFDASGGVDRVVLDFRGNSGGLLLESIEFARLFVGPERNVKLVHFITRGAKVAPEMSRRQNENLLQKLVRRLREQRQPSSSETVPIVILVDRFTASASELVAAALRDNCRAVLVGTKTFGKSSIQAIIRSGEGSAYALTVAKYTTPKNEPIVGLEPDIVAEFLPRGKRAVTSIFPKLDRRLHGVVSGCESEETP